MVTMNPGKMPSVPDTSDSINNVKKTVKDLQKTKKTINDMKKDIEKTVGEINKSIGETFGKSSRICLSSTIKIVASILKLAGLKEHAEYELKKSGLFAKSSDYSGLLGKSVLELCETFSKQGHSGTSAEYALDLFNKLARFKTISPITNDPDEWHIVSNTDSLWQSKRDPSFFSKDGGKTWYSL